MTLRDRTTRFAVIRLRMRPASRPGGRTAASLALVAGIVLVLAAGCGGSMTQAPSPASPGAGIVAEVASYRPVVDQPGRLLVALISGDNHWLSFGSVDARFEYLGTGDGSPAPGVTVGPATAGFLAIPGSPEGTGRAPTLTLPSDGRGVYAVETITFPMAGFWQVTASGRLEDGSTFEASAAFTVYDEPSTVTVGAMAPRSDNPISAAAGVPATAIDSRAVTDGTIPDPELHAISIARAIALRHALVVVFSTPVYCVSRFCGPVTDMVGDLARQYEDRADFVHVEIYRDFAAGLVNQTAIDWLQTGNEDLREPWTFFVGADGRIAGSWDTVVTRAELEPILAALPVKP
jgi:hypothetical protein